MEYLLIPVIFSKNIYQKVYPASTTKLLTALTCLKYADVNTLVTIEEDNCGITTPGAQLCGFKKGDTLTIDQLLHCLMIYSGNDAGEIALNMVRHKRGRIIKKTRYLDWVLTIKFRIRGFMLNR